jgi:hypothetical protein
MKKTYSLAMLLTLLVGLMFGGAVMAAEHGGDAVESDSSSSSEHAAEGAHNKDAKGDEHAGDAAKSEKADHGSDSEHVGDSAEDDG